MQKIQYEVVWLELSGVSGRPSTWLGSFLCVYTLNVCVYYFETHLCCFSWANPTGHQWSAMLFMSFPIVSCSPSLPLSLGPLSDLIALLFSSLMPSVLALLSVPQFPFPTTAFLYFLAIPSFSQCHHVPLLFFNFLFYCNIPSFVLTVSLTSIYLQISLSITR